MLVAKDDFEWFLKKRKMPEDDVRSIMRSFGGTIKLTPEMEVGTMPAIIWRYSLNQEKGVMTIEPILNIKQPKNVTEENVRRTVRAAWQRVWDYGVEHSSAESMQSMENWLHDRFYLGKSSVPNKEFARLEKYMGAAHNAVELVLSSLPMRAASGYGIQLHFPPIVLTMIFCWEAEKCLEHNELGKAWYWAGRAKHWSSRYNLPKNPNKMTKNRASAGGKSRAEKHYSWLKKKIGDVLRHAPLQWLKNMKKATEYIVNEADVRAYYEDNLAENAEVNGANLNWENFENTVYSWIREDKKLRKIFEKSKNQKPK